MNEHGLHISGFVSMIPAYFAVSISAACRRSTKMTTAVGIGLGLLIPTAHAQPVEFEGNYYVYVGAAVNWDVARDAAAAMSFAGAFGHLATITSQAENDFLFGLSPTATGSFRGAWIGLKIASNLETWEVGPEAGDTLAYRNWGGIEPNNGRVGQTSYGYIQTDAGNHAGISPGEWADARNGFTSGAIGGDPVVGYFVEFEAIPNPLGDFNGDGSWNCLDIDSLVAALASGSGDSSFDLTGDGIVDLQDLDEWRVQGGAVNLPSGNPYLPGDANLDGFVDASDFNIWNSNRLSHTAAWCSGDFNADGFVDASDFNVWNSHRLMSSGGAPAAVPEPEALWLSFIALAWLASLRRRG